MSFNLYLYEKAREAYFQELLREAEKRRMLSRLLGPRRSTSRRAAGKLGLLLLKLGTSLKQFEQSDPAFED